MIAGRPSGPSTKSVDAVPGSSGLAAPRAASITDANGWTDTGETF